jgi:hypothetical protein
MFDNNEAVEFDRSIENPADQAFKWSANQSVFLVFVKFFFNLSLNSDDGTKSGTHKTGTGTSQSFTLPRICWAGSEPVPVL